MSMKLLSMTDVVAKTGYCRATIYNKMKSGDFPKPADLGGRGKRWLEETVDAFLIERMNAAQHPS